MVRMARPVDAASARNYNRPCADRSLAVDLSTGEGRASNQRREHLGCSADKQLVGGGNLCACCCCGGGGCISTGNSSVAVVVVVLVVVQFE